MTAAPILFSALLGLWWARVALSLCLSGGAGGALSVLIAIVVLWVCARLGHRFVARGVDGQGRISRGFLALGLSFGLGALPLAAAMMRAGESAGAVAAGAANPLGPIFGTALAPILAGNLVAGLMVGLAAAAALICLILAAVLSGVAASGPGAGK